jgi:hypothetical protein
MFIETMASLLRVYTDEPDQTVETDALVALWLELAYSDFRSMVADIDPTIYMVSHDVSMGANSTIDLNNVLLGSSPTQPRMDTLVDVTRIEGNTEYRLRGGTSIGDVTHGSADYVLINRKLHFPIDRNSGTYRIYYMPTQLVNWTAGIVAGSNTYLDDLHRFHDIIPLIAYLQYAIVDAADHPQQQQLLFRRQAQLKSYLSTRGGAGAFEVVDSRWMEP